MTQAREVRTSARRVGPALAILGAALLTAGLVLGGAPAPLRIPAAAFLFLAAAGLAWTPVLGLHRDRLLAAVTVLALSISCDIVVVQAVMWWSGLDWVPCVWILALITAAGAIVQTTVRSRSW